jgi:hypothetical protein
MPPRLTQVLAATVLTGLLSGCGLLPGPAVGVAHQLKGVLEDEAPVELRLEVQPDPIVTTTPLDGHYAFDGTATFRGETYSLTGTETFSHTRYVARSVRPMVPSGGGSGSIAAILWDSAGTERFHLTGLRPYFTVGPDPNTPVSVQVYEGEALILRVTLRKVQP